MLLVTGEVPQTDVTGVTDNNGHHYLGGGKRRGREEGGGEEERVRQKGRGRRGGEREVNQCHQEPEKKLMLRHILPTA